MSERFYLDESIEDDVAWLDGDQAHHLLHVMRARPGDEVVLFDGAGTEYAARVEKCERRRVLLAVLSRAEVDREVAIRLELGVALPRGDRQRWLVEKCVELGVTRVTPLVATHGVAQPSEQTLARLKRGVIEASKQCGRNRLMEIAEPRSWPDFASLHPAASLRLLAHPAGRQRDWADFDRTQVGAPAGAFVAAVGPEGGWTDEELDVARRNAWDVVGLGPRILRVETAAVAMAVLLGAIAAKG